MSKLKNIFKGKLFVALSPKTKNRSTLWRCICDCGNEKIARNNGHQTIITGESLGQVASQTIESITSSNSVVTMPVLRPLIAFDKLDIIEISEKIGTYETSILPYEDCCTVFLPKHPLIKPNLEKVKIEEGKLEVEKLIDDAISSLEIIDL